MRVKNRVINLGQDLNRSISPFYGENAKNCIINIAFLANLWPFKVGHFHGNKNENLSEKENVAPDDVIWIKNTI